MIVLIVCVMALAGSNLWLWLVHRNEQMELDKLNALIANLGLTVSRVQGSSAVDHAKLEKQDEMISLLCEKVAGLENREGVDTEEIEKMLDKKWEDAINQISNFDPFGEKDR